MHYFNRLLLTKFIRSQAGIGCGVHPMGVRHSARGQKDRGGAGGGGGNNSPESPCEVGGYFWWDPPYLLFLSAGERSAAQGRR